MTLKTWRREILANCAASCNATFALAQNFRPNWISCALWALLNFNLTFPLITAAAAGLDRLIKPAVSRLVSRAGSQQGHDWSLTDDWGTQRRSSGGGGSGGGGRPSLCYGNVRMVANAAPSELHSLVDLKAVCERCRQILESCGPGRMHKAALPLRRSSTCPSGDKGQNSTQKQKHLTFGVCSVFLCACVKEFSSSSSSSSYSP